MIGTKNVGLFGIGTKAIFDVKANAHHPKKNLSPKPIDGVGVGLPLFFLEEKISERKKQQKNEDEPKAAPNRVK
jgi:hypothetical protein